VSRFVLDNTVTMAWCFSDETTEFTEALLNRLSNLTDSAIVPALWLYEVVNVTGLAVRKGRVSEDKARFFLESLADLPIEIEDPTRTLSSCPFGRWSVSINSPLMTPPISSSLSVTNYRLPPPIMRWRRPRGKQA
jgi:hypothetical protein